MNIARCYTENTYPCWSKSLLYASVFCLFAFVPCALSAVEWTGRGDTSAWSDSDNWSVGKIPGPTDVAEFSSSAAIYLSGECVVSCITNVSSSPITLKLTVESNVRLAAPICGAITVEKYGEGTLTFATSQSYTGETHILEGRILSTTGQLLTSGKTSGAMRARQNGLHFQSDVAGLRSRVDKGASDSVAAPVNVGDRLQVMWDDHVVDAKRTTATRLLHHPTYAGTVMEWDKPWEGDGSEFPNVIADTDKNGKRLYRMYYVGWNFTEDILKAKKWPPSSSSYRIRTCYAESRDGINWVRPNLGLVEHEGSKNNNILASFETPTWKYNFFVFKDGNPSCPTSERYKAISSGRGSGGHLCVLTSADGIHFKKGWKILKLAPRAVMDDTSLASFWHPKTGKYHVYLRGNRLLKKEERGQMFTDHEVRQVRHAEFMDLHRIEESRVIDCITPDGEVSEEYPMYTSCTFPYYRNPDIIVGFPSRYNQRSKWDANYDLLPDVEHRKYRCKRESRMGLVVTDGLFMVSRDGQKFVRYDEAFLRPGRQRPCSWVYGSCYPGAFVIPTPAADGSGDELSIYKPLGHMTGKPAKLERFTIRIDGFVSRHATFKEQKVVTKPFIFSGREMVMNFSTSGRGRIAAYLYLDGVEKPSLASTWMFGDRVDSPVTFPKGRLAAFAGKTVRLEFVMSDADLYSFRFK